MKLLYTVAAAALAIPLSAQVATTGPAVPVTGAAPGPASAGTLAGPAGGGTVTVQPGTGSNPVNPGGIIGSQPSIVGRTFSRPAGTFGNSAGTILTPGPGVSASGYPPPVGPVAPIVTNTGIGGFYNGVPSPPEAQSFPPGAPPFFGNTLRPNFAAPMTNFPPIRASSVNLPPGATVLSNGVPVPSGSAVVSGVTPTGVPQPYMPAKQFVPAPGSSASGPAAGSAAGAPARTQTGIQAGRIGPLIPPAAPGARPAPAPAPVQGARIAPIPKP